MTRDETIDAILRSISDDVREGTSNLAVRIAAKVDVARAVLGAEPQAAKPSPRYVRTKKPSTAKTHEVLTIYDSVKSYSETARITGVSDHWVRKIVRKRAGVEDAHKEGKSTQ